MAQGLYLQAVRRSCRIPDAPEMVKETMEQIPSAEIMLTRQERSSAPIGFVLAMCWLGLLAEGYDNGVVGSVIPFIRADALLHLSAYQLGTIASSSMIGMFFGGFLFGKLGDIYNKKTIFIICFTIFSIAMGLGGLVHHFWQFVTTRIIGGAAVAGIVPLASTITTMISNPKRKHLSFGIMYSGYVVGLFLSTIFVVLFGNILPWRNFVLGSFVPLIILPIFIIYIPSYPPSRINRIQDAVFDVEDVKTEDFGSFYPSLRAKFGFYSVYVFGMLVAYGLSMWLPQIMIESGMSTTKSIFFLTVYSGASAFSALIIGWIADQIGARPVVTLGFICGAFGLVGLGYANSYFAQCLFCALSGAGTMAVSILVTSYVAEWFGTTKSSSMIGSCISVSRLGAVAGPYLSATMSAIHAERSVQFSFYAIVAVLASASILMVPKNRRIKEGK